MSIIDEKYKGKYKGASDWAGLQLEEQCYDAQEKGPAIPNLNKMIKLAKANKMDKDKLAEMEARSGAANAIGNIRMAIGNMLRAAAKRRFGLYDLAGEWVKAPKDFLVDGDGQPLEKATEDHDGNKVDKPAAKAKAKEVAAPAKKAAKKAPARKKAA